MFPPTTVSMFLGLKEKERCVEEEGVINKVEDLDKDALRAHLHPTKAKSRTREAPQKIDLFPILHLEEKNHTEVLEANTNLRAQGEVAAVEVDFGEAGAINPVASTRDETA